MAERERIPLEYQSQLADDYETDVPPEDEAYSLEEILEEYGGGLERKLSEGAVEPAEPPEERKRNGLRSGLASLADRVRHRPRPEPGSRERNWESPDSRESFWEGQDSRKLVREERDSRKPVREVPDSRKPVRDGQDSRKPVWDGQDSRKPVWDGQDSRKLVREGQDSRKPVREGQDSRKPVRDGQDSRKPVRDGQDSRKPIREERDSRKPIREERDSRESVREEADSEAEPPDSFSTQPEGRQEPEPPSFAEMARETAERTSRLLDGLRGLLGRVGEPLRRWAAAVRRAAGGIRLPALPAGTRIPVLSAVGDWIEAARRKRRPKRNRGQPVPIPGRRKKRSAVPPEADAAEPVDRQDSPEALDREDTEPAGAVTADGVPESLEPDVPDPAAAETDESPDGEAEIGTGEPPDGEAEIGTGEPPGVEADAGTDESPDGEVETGTADSTDQSGRETSTTDKSGREADSADKSGTKADSTDQRGAEADSTDKSGTKADSTDKSGRETNSTDKSGRETSTTDKSGREADSAGQSGRETDSPDQSDREADSPEPHSREADQPSRQAGHPRRRSLFQRLAALRILFQRNKTGEGPIGPEIPLHDAAARFREAYTRRQVPPLALAAGGLPSLLLLLEWAGFSVPLWSDIIPLRCLLTLLCIAATAYLCRQVFTGSVTAFACGVSAAAAGCDCLVRMASASRSPGDGFGAVACLALIVAQWGVSLESRGRFETFRAASLDDEPPYLVTDMAQGACKQKGATPGFYSTAMRPDVSTIWQSVLLPLTLTVSLAFAGISSFGRNRPADFFLNWSAILAAGATFTLALCWGLPWAHLARRLQKSGGAVAGWAGAEKISRQKNMIVTDADLFPTGSVQLNGIRLFGGDMDVAVSYAAAMTKEASCGLERPFDELLHTELGESAAAPEAEEFNFYEEGGYGAAINGQSVLMGTAAFLRRMGVLLPRDLKVPGGMFLAVEHKLLAVFAIRYNVADNVDYALRMMRRSGVTPLLAVRDPNITPAMLQRKFRRKIPARYPDLAGRIALSEVEFDRDAPRALLFREGLLPYAEAVVGCRRLCGGVRRATILSEFGSLAGMLLTFYLCSQAKFELLTPLSLTVFLLLWLLPVLLVMELF